MRYARGEAILRVIAMRYAPQLIVSQNEGVLLANLVWSKNSCGVTRVVFQEPPKPFATFHRAFTFCALADRRKEQHVALALMIPLVMKMLHILRQRMLE